MSKKEPSMVLICAQPCLPYYAWQVEVMLTNFEEKGLDKYDIRCLFAYNKYEEDWENNIIEMKKIEKRFKKVAKFYFYQDTRVFPLHYVSSIRPHLLKKHFLEYPELSSRRVFYHDCDIVFTKTPTFFDLIPNELNNWYVSNTIDYIGADYIIKCGGDDIFHKMCEIVGIHPSLVYSMQEHSGGAQYIMTGVDYWFWDKVEKDCENMFREITEVNALKLKDNPNHDFQIWCSDMWAVLWNGWMRGFNTYVVKELDFTWAVETIDRWDENYIFHNAGVEDADRDKFFLKADYMNEYPYLSNKEYSKEYASYKYHEIIKSIGNKSCLL
jgi:hypothetical protein